MSSRSNLKKPNNIGSDINAQSINIISEEINEHIDEILKSANNIAVQLNNAGSIAVTSNPLPDRILMIQIITTMDYVNKFTNEINQISKDVCEVSIQMNYFLLGTAVGLPKAGKFNQGCAVIYDEVKKLAQYLRETVRKFPDIQIHADEKTTPFINQPKITEATIEEKKKNLMFSIHILAKTFLLMEKQLILVKDLVSLACRVANKTEIAVTLETEERMRKEMEKIKN